jgi:hypothetical protein
MNLIIAAGLFDSPWTIAIFLLAGALINWLSQRRANKAGNDPASETDSASPAPAAPNWEERLRRMLEEKTPERSVPAAPPAKPPPLIRRPPSRSFDSVPPVIVPVERQAAPPLRPPPVEIVPGTELELSEPLGRRYELSSAAHQAQAHQARRRLQLSKAKRPVLGSLRNPQTARQAFVGSLVFGAPKGLES